MSFDQLGVKPEIVSALAEMGITTPTTIQEKTIPLLKEGKDLVGISRTGSGKTAAFAIPLIEKIIPGQGLQAIIIVPTRELAVQISQELYKFGKNMEFEVATIFGGVAFGPQLDAMENSEIMVGTPGRTLDHLGRGSLDLSRVKTVILDEADKMAEMGFIEDVSRILDGTPKDRQTVLFGATISYEVGKLRQYYMKDPAEVKAEEQVEEQLLEQYYYNVAPFDKFSMLVHLINKEQTKKVIIFCSAKSTVDLVAKNLKMNGFIADALHGDMQQNKRLKVLEQFNAGKINMLVASAVASRGLDVKEVTHVFNYDLPQDPQEYIHRVGRTARAGESGKAITLLSDRDHEAFRLILRRYRVPVKAMPPEEFKRLHFDARREDGPRGEGARFGGRPGPGRFGAGDRFGNRGGSNSRYGPNKDPHRRNGGQRRESSHQGGGQQQNSGGYGGFPSD